jgi:hypothetical protein
LCYVLLCSWSFPARLVSWLTATQSDVTTVWIYYRCWVNVWCSLLELTCELPTPKGVTYSSSREVFIHCSMVVVLRSTSSIYY